jgi:hypothetical protein
MMLLGALGYAALVSLLLRADLLRLKDVKLRFEALLPLGLAFQVAVSYIPGIDSDRVAVAWLAGALLVLIAAISNWRYLGLRVVATGVLLNAVVIVGNGGMPVSLQALQYLGATDIEAVLASSSPLYFMADEATVLLLFGDVLPVPGPSLIRSVASAGDVLLMIGVVVLVLEMSGVELRTNAQTRIAS